MRVKAEVYRTTRLRESYWPATAEKVLLESTIGQELRKAAAEVPDRVALVEGIPEYTKRRRWTYAQLLAEAERVARALLTRYKPGDKIALWGDNIPEWVLTQMGVALAGMVLVTLNPAFRKREAHYQLEQSDSVALFCIDEYRGYDVLATSRELCGEIPALREVIRFGELEAFMNSASDSVAFPEVRPEDLAMIIYTSGTTGNPKGTMLYHRAIVSGIHFMTDRVGIETGAIWMNAMPCFHYGGVGYSVIGNLICRSTNVLVRTFEPSNYLEMCDSENATVVFVVPAMMEMMLANYDPKKHHLNIKHFMGGAAKTEVSLANRIKEVFGCEICISFGQTETHGGITETHQDDTVEDKCNSLGQPFPLIDIKIVDPDTDKVLPLNTVGEICTRGYCTMLGYYKMPEETARTIRDGWLHTGDLGSMDERGFVYFEGRLKDVIVRGGEKIFPAEVEALLRENPKVGQVAVVGIPHPKWGEEVAAVIIPKSPDEKPNFKELDEFCKENLTAFKRPRMWAFVDEFPYTLNMKLQKFKIVEQIVRGQIETERT